MTYRPADDLLADHLLGKAVIEGASPYVSLETLANEYGYGPAWPFSSPRTPAALLVDVPLASTAPATAVRLVTILNATALVMVVAWSAASAGLPAWLAMLACPLVLGSFPGRLLLETQNLGLLIGLATVGSWLGAKRLDAWWVGIPLGLAAAIRIYPALLILAMWVGGRRKVARSAVATAATATAAGLLLPAVTVAGTVQVLAEGIGFADTNWNSSLPGALAYFANLPPLAVSSGLFLGLIAWLLVKRPAWDRGMGIAAPSVLIALPVSWPFYAAMAGPSIARAAETRGVWLLTLVLWYLPILTWNSWPVLLSLMVVVGIVAVHDRTDDLESKVNRTFGDLTPVN